MSGRAWMLFGVMSVLWGLPFLFVKVAIGELEPIVVTFARTALAAGVLLPFAVARGGFRQLKGRWRAVFSLAVLQVFAPFLMITFGEQHITSSLAGILVATVPLFVAVLALRFDPSERVSPIRLIGLLIGAAGVCALLGLELGSDPYALPAALMVLLAALCYAGCALVVKRTFTDIPALPTVTASLTIATLLLAALLPTAGPSHFPDSQVAASLLGLGIVCTAIGFLVYFALVAEAGASRASVVTYVNPAIAVLLGALILGEIFTPRTLAGCLLILAGSWIATGSRFPWVTRLYLSRLRS